VKPRFGAPAALFLLDKHRGAGFRAVKRPASGSFAGCRAQGGRRAAGAKTGAVIEARIWK